MTLRGAAILAVLTALAPACGDGGGGGIGFPPSQPAFTPLVPVNTSAFNHLIDTTQSDAGITAQLNTALAAGGIIVFNNGGTKTVTLTAELLLPADKTAVLDGNYNAMGRITLSGGGTRRILAKSDRSDLTVQRIDFIDGVAATEGGAIRTLQNGFLTVIDCQFTDCRTTALLGPDIGGGAIRPVNDRLLQVSGSTFTNCDGPNGGAIDSIGTQITLINCTFTQCDATGTGGGGAGNGGIGGAVYVDGVHQRGLQRRLDISGCTFTSNRAKDHGGAVFVFTYDGTGSVVNIDRSTFSGNSVTSPPTPAVGAGGAVYQQGNILSLTRCTFDGNTTITQGGGIWAICTSGRIENCTFSGNQAMGSPGFGGAMRIFGTVLVNSCTISGNHAAGWGGGIFAASAGSVTLQNTLLMNNTGVDTGNGWNVNTPLAFGSNNLQWPTTRGGGGPADTPARPGITFADAGLQPLADNTGPTRTMAITGGPAVNAGNIAAPAKDQRDVDRSGAPDIGAFERNP